tara:strand:- start:181 stop:459 length:279 start_codon:yes stop_codon:yes gene_type:complete
MNNFVGNYDNFKEFAALKRTTITWILLNLEVITENEERTEKFKAACELSKNCLDDKEKERLLVLLEDTKEDEIVDLINYFFYLVRERNAEKI